MEEARMTSEGQHAGQQPAEATSGGQAEPFGDEGFPPDSDTKGRASATPAAGFPTSYAPPPHATPNGGSPFVVPTVFGQPGAPQPPSSVRPFPDAPANRYGIPTAQPGQGAPAEGQPQSGQLEPGGSQPDQLQPGQLQPGQLQPGQLQPGQLQPGQAHPGQAQVPDPADRTTPPPFAPPTTGAARAPAPGDGPALPRRTSSLPQRATGSSGAPPSAWAPPPAPPTSDDPFGRPAEAHPYRSDDQESGFTGFAPGSPTRARAGLDDPGDSDQPAAPFERPGPLADGPSSGSPFARSSRSAFERPSAGSAFERPSAGSAFERPSAGSAFERPTGTPEFDSGQPPAPLGRPGSLPERPASGAAGDRPPGVSAFGDQRVRVPGASLTGLPDAPTSGRGGQPAETPGALPTRTPAGPESSPLPRRGGALPVRGQSGPADESPFGAARDGDAAQAYRPGAAQPFGEPAAQPFGEPAAQPFGGIPAAQPFGGGSPAPFGQPAQPYGESGEQPYGQAQGLPYETEQPSSGGPQQYGRPATGDSVFGRPESPFGQPSGDHGFGRTPSSDEHPYARPTGDAGSPFAPPAAGGPISGGPTSGGSGASGSIFGGSAAAQASPGQAPGAGREESGANPGPVYGRPAGSTFGAGQDGQGFGEDEEGTRFGGDDASGSGNTGGGLFGGFVPRGTSPENAERSSFGPAADRPGFGTTPDGPPFGTTPDRPAFGTNPDGAAFGTTPDRPAFGTNPDGAAFGTTPDRPAFGTTPDRPAFGSADDGPAFGSNGGGGNSGMSSADNGRAPSNGGYAQRVPGASFAASGMPVGTEQRNGSVPQPRDPAEPPATGSARAVSASASVPTASRVAPVDPGEVPPPVAAPQARVYGRPAQPSEPDDDAERPEPGDSAYPSSAGPASPAPGRVAGRATASARVALPGSEAAQAGPPFTEPTTDVAGRGRPGGPEAQPGMVQPGAPLPPDRYGENTTDISHRGAGMDPTYVPAPAVSSMHARPPLEHGFPPAPDADQGFERPDRPRMGGLFPGPQSGPSVAPPNPDQTSSWPGVPAQVPDDHDQGRFEQFRPEPEAPPARPETQHVRMLPIIISVIVGAALLVGLAIGIVWLISRGSDSGGGISVAAGECVKRSGDEAIKAQCGDTGVFQVVSIAATKEQCADQAQPYVLNPTKDGKTQVLCLKPSS
jgi:collagen type III alpha